MNNKIYVHVSKKGHLLGFYTNEKASNDRLKQNSDVTVEIFENVKTIEKQALNTDNVSDCFTAKQMSEAFNDGEKNEARCEDGFDINNYAIILCILLLLVIILPLN